MPASYDGTILDHLAEHMLYLSTASLFWFSLSSSHDHDCHLSQRLGITPHDYECLLVAANLAQFHPKWGFTMKIVQWKWFLEGHWFTTSNGRGTFEVDTKKLDLTAFINGTPKICKEQCHFIQIGIINNYSTRKIEMQKDCDGRMIVTPPGLNGLWIKQQSFRQYMDPFVWNYVVDNGLEQGKEVEDSSGEDNESVLSSPDILSKLKVSPPSSVAGASITPVKSATPVDNMSLAMALWRETYLAKCCNSLNRQSLM